MCFLVLSILTLFSFAQGAELSCSGCVDPVQAFTVWTDDSEVWQCESLRRRFVGKCSDVAEVTCGREDNLGGSLYIMTFPKTPDDVGIKPDHVRKTKGSTVQITLNCVSGEWMIRNRTRAQHYILCDQFIIDDKSSVIDTTDSDSSPDGPEAPDDYTEPSDGDTTEPMETEETEATEETTEMETTEAMETRDTDTMGTTESVTETTTVAVPMADPTDNKATVLPTTPTEPPSTESPTETLVETKNKVEDQTTTNNPDKPEGPRNLGVVPKKKVKRPRTTTTTSTTEATTTEEVPVMSTPDSMVMDVVPKRKTPRPRSTTTTEATTVERGTTEGTTTEEVHVVTTTAQPEQPSTTVAPEVPQTTTQETEVMTTGAKEIPDTTTSACGANTFSCVSSTTEAIETAKTTITPGYDEFGVEIPPEVKVPKTKPKRPNTRKQTKKGLKKLERNGNQKKGLRSVKPKPNIDADSGKKPLRSPSQSSQDR